MVEPRHPDAADGLEQALGAGDVGGEEVAGAQDRQRVVRLRGEVDDDVDAVGAQQVLDELGVADGAVHELDAASSARRDVQDSRTPA